MKFKDFIFESMDSEIENIEIIEKTKELVRIRFKAGQTPYLVVFVLNKKNSSWEILFGVEKDLEIVNNYSKRWALRFTKDENPFIVLKGVIESIKLFLKKEKADSVCLYFRTKDEKRKGIFEKIIDKMKKNKFASGFNFEIVDEKGTSIFNMCKNKGN